MASNGSRQLALVTGASSGIGYELARQFAEHGFDLVITAENEELPQAAAQLRSTGAQVQSVQVDLARPEGVEELYERVRSIGRPLDAVALNAGRGAGGAFASVTRLEDELEIVDLNVRSTVH